MPYIKMEDRPKIDKHINDLKYPINGPGELNYAITRLCWLYLNMGQMKYADMNEVIGVLECVKQEFYRKPVAQYEDKKTAENGEVYN